MTPTEAFNAFMNVEPPPGGHRANGPCGMAKHIAKRYLGDASRWRDVKPFVMAALNQGNLISRKSGQSMAYWPRQFDRTPITT